MEELSQNEEVFRLYGKFLINFEQVSHLMRYGILYILFPDLSYRHMRQNEILMESLTADQIRNKLMALITEDFKSNTAIFKLSKTISNVYERIIPIRNSFAHGTSFIGATSANKDAQDGLLLLRHPKLRKEGLDLNFKKYEIDALKQGIYLFEKLRFSVATVTITIQTVQNNQKYADGYDHDKYLESLSLELIRLEKKLQALLSK